MPHVSAAEQPNQSGGVIMNNCDGMSSEVGVAFPQDVTRSVARLIDDADTDARNQLIDFIAHRAFYPVLMVDRVGPHRALIEHVQAATRAKIDRLRSYSSAEEVIDNFERDFRSRTAQDITSELKLLHLPTIDDLRDEFERKARELGSGLCIRARR